MAVAFLLAAAASAVTAHSPIAWFGLYNLGTGWIFLSCCAGAYAVGRALDAEAARWAVGGIIAGAVVNAVVAVLQGPFDLRSSHLPLIDNRSTGLAGNPVFLGVLAASAACLVMTALPRRRWLTLGLASLLAAAVQLSGARSSLLLLFLAVPLALLTDSRRGAAAVALALLVGLASGYALSSARPSSGAVTRTADPSGGVGVRMNYWSVGFDASLAKPVLGWGPGRFRAATITRRTFAIAHTAGPDQIYDDAHNLLVEQLTTTGGLGLTLFIAWLVMALRGTRGSGMPAVAVGTVVLFLGHGLEPQNVMITPLMFLLLGLMARTRLDAGTRRVWIATGTLAVVVAVAGGRLIFGDVSLRQAIIYADDRKARSATRLLPPWSQPLKVEAGVLVHRGAQLDQPALLEKALAVADRAIGREPNDEAAYVPRADAFSFLGDHREAASAYGSIFSVNPWSRAAAIDRAAELRLLGDATGAAACSQFADLVVQSGREPEARAARAKCLTSK